MCTCMALRENGFYFGRNMDMEDGFGERVVVVPRHLPFSFRMAGKIDRHYAMIGMAAVAEGYPLFADAMNERGLCMAGLHFPGNAYYEEEPMTDRTNLAPFELIPYLLGKCATVEEAEEELSRIRLVSLPFSEKLPLTPLHWFLADRERSIAIEPMRSGQLVFDDPAHVLTNNPPLSYHLANLQQYGNLTDGPLLTHTPLGEFCIAPFGFGLGSVGLPGDYSSPSRFVKAAYLARTSVCPSNADEVTYVLQMFRLLGAVAPPRGSVRNDRGECHLTTYSCCMDVGRGAYFYTTESNLTPTAIRFSTFDLTRDTMVEFSLRKRPEIRYEK